MHLIIRLYQQRTLGVDTMPAYKERAPGNYPSRFIKLDEDYKITDRETGEEVVRWRWVFQELADSTTIGEMDTLTTPGFKSRSNGLKFFTGMLGRAPREGDNTDTLVGQTFDVTYGPNQNGRYTIVAVTKPVGSKADVVEFRGAKVDVTDPTATPMTTPEGDGGTEDDQLPF